MIDHIKFPKIPRLNRGMTITEKIDGTNAAVNIIAAPFTPPWSDPPEGLTAFVSGPDYDDDGYPLTEYQLYAQSRNRVITPDNDNYGFAGWVRDNAEYLVETLGPGLHFGEWWGQGIQRNYQMKRKVFSLFNTERWGHVLPCGFWPDADGPTLGVVPVLWLDDLFDTNTIQDVLARLKGSGSKAALGFEKPEGIVIRHDAGNHLYKVLAENDDIPKSDWSQELNVGQMIRDLRIAS